MGVVGDAELVGDGEQQRVGFRDRLVLPELFDQDVRLGGIAAAEDGAGLLVDEADLVGFLAPSAEIGAVAIIDEREDAAADGDARFARVTGLFPGGEIFIHRQQQLVW